jgi:hypothetical protein
MVGVNFEAMRKEIEKILEDFNSMEIDPNEAIDKLLNLHIVRLSLPDNLEEEILKSKRFRKCDWIDVDGINYLKMMPETEIAKMVRDIVKKSNEA